jgi:hypothetical protein
METDELVQRLRERRLTTLALADQIKEDRWREPALPGGRSIHDLLSHILAWDEWAVATFEISAHRELPPVLRRALADVDAFNEKAVARHHGISRDDLLSGLQAASPRVLSSARVGGGAEWEKRRIEGLLPEDIIAGGPPNRKAPSVRSILRMLLEHEAEHDQEIMDAFGITPNLERLRDDQDGDTGGDQAGG